MSLSGDADATITIRQSYTYVYHIKITSAAARISNSNRLVCKFLYVIARSRVRKGIRHLRMLIKYVKDEGGREGQLAYGDSVSVPTIKKRIAEPAREVVCRCRRVIEPA